MSYKVGDIVICHLIKGNTLIPDSYFEAYQDRVGEVVDVCGTGEDATYHLDISEPDDYFFEDELLPFNEVNPIDFDEVLDLIDRRII